MAIDSHFLLTLKEKNVILLYVKELFKRGDCMLEDKINKKREELNKSLEKENNYSDTYKLSVELDNLIAEFYKNSKKEKSKKEKHKILFYFA